MTNLLSFVFPLWAVFTSAHGQGKNFTTNLLYTYALITIESPLMFLGPGQGNGGISEVFSLPTASSGLASATCSVPTYPLTDIWGSVGFVHDGYLQICGKVTLSLSLSLSN